MSRFSGGTKVQMERVVAIVEIIQSSKFPNCKSLAEELEVSAKTIQRDINFIRDRLNLPVEYDEREYGYYFSSEVEGLTQFDIQVEDLAALFLAKQTMGSLRGTKLAEMIRPAFDKMSQWMQGKVSLTHMDMEDVFSVKSSGAVATDLTVFGRFAEAVLKTKRVKFNYVDLEGKSSKRELEPHHVGEVNGGWYVVGMDVKKNSIRTFALQRVSDLQILTDVFEKPTSVEDPFSGGIGVWTGDGNYHVKLEVDGWVARLVQERVWHPSQVVTVQGEVVVVEMDVSALEDLVGLVLSWGAHVKIIGPKKLKDLVVEELKNMQHSY